MTFASIYRRKKAMLTLGQAALEDAWEYMAPRECALFILDETACILSRNMIRKPFAAAKCTGIQ